MIIHDTDAIGTFVIDFLHRSGRHWCAKKQIRPGVTSIDLVFIEELKEDEVVE
jgi:hypothetical protein